MKKNLFFIFVLSLIITVFSGCREKNQSATNQLDSAQQQEAKEKTETKKESPVPPKNDQISAIAVALELYKQQKSEGVNFDNGPCLSEKIIPDWVVDITRNPRTETDNLPENQCSAFRRGQAHHFVELDPEGRVIRTM